MTTQRKRRLRPKAAVEPVTAASPPVAGRVVPLPAPRERAAEAHVLDGACGKCGSTFVSREPAFLHCHYCGSLARIASGSLLEQELFEIRSGLRLAS